MKKEIYDLYSQRNIPENVIYPASTHFTNIIEIKTGKENLENCDGIFTSVANNYSLGIKTADCAVVSFCGEKRNYTVISMCDV